MLKNNFNQKGHQKLDRTTLRKTIGGGPINACPGVCTHRVSGKLVEGCAEDQQCTGYLCSNGMWASICM